ncbi:hypothetical protein GIB67_031772 [Kingdonia uniflora]|uniref:Alpha-1,3-mannosyl-glycoprotein 2-beta-N-acetylglucosaminyltransferase n=1 Tax=Kingdonia uniflora TaxID=39325 RepID=A0A7J7L4H8_9MAGN|nr:hypothetical protein GIB67_031772 [Kingdonia uniflora]
MAFSKKKIEAKKNWLRKFNPETHLDQKEKLIKYSDFVNKELILFSMADLQRSIPSMVDSLKPGQRKILFCSFKQNITKEVKVAQFSGYVLGHSAYYHGERNLAGTIIGMAQDFVGINNINLLQPNGQYGNRHQGGKDHASASCLHLLYIQMRLFGTHSGNGLFHLKKEMKSQDQECGQLRALVHDLERKGAQNVVDKLQVPVAAVVVMACNHPNYLERTIESILKYQHSVASKFLLFISQDGPNENSNYLEDDIEILPDFFDYFEAAATIMDKDRTIMAISTWNDNGQKQFVHDPKGLYRSDILGLGWMLTNITWDELSPKWPKAYWDDWLRLKGNHKEVKREPQRSTIRRSQSLQDVRFW